MNFTSEINALDDNFYQFYYEIQNVWAGRNEIDYSSVKSLWDLINNVRDNLDDKGVTLPQIQEAVFIVERMNEMVNEILEDGDSADEGILFKGTREQYNEVGRKLAYSLYELEPHLVSARVELEGMNK